MVLPLDRVTTLLFCVALQFARVLLPTEVKVIDPELSSATTTPKVSTEVEVVLTQSCGLVGVSNAVLVNVNVPVAPLPLASLLIIILVLVVIAVTIVLSSMLVPLTFIPIRILLVSLIGNSSSFIVAVVVDLVTVVVGLLNATKVETSVIHLPPRI